MIMAIYFMSCHLKHPFDFTTSLFHSNEHSNVCDALFYMFQSSVLSDHHVTLYSGHYFQ